MGGVDSEGSHTPGAEGLCQERRGLQEARETGTAFHTMAEVVAEAAEVAEMPTQMSPGAVEMSTPMLGEKMEMLTEVTGMTPGEALASSLFFQFMCSECGSLYNTLEEVLSHQEQHVPTVTEEEALTTQDTGLEPQLVPGTEDGPFQCGECSQLILSPSELLAHQDAHLRESASQIQYQCGDCQELFPSPELWERMSWLHSPHWKGPSSAQHLSAAAAAKPPVPPPLPPLPSPPPPPAPPEVRMEPYECPECSALCTTPEEFLEHQGTHFDSLEKEERNGLEEEEEGEDEEDDDEETEDEEEAAAEVGDDAKGADKSTAGQAQGCGDCPQRCTSAGARRRHRRASRGPASAAHPFHCSQCQRSFSSANRLLAHGRAHVGGTHECTTCSKVFKKAASLEQHLRLHRGEARYLCVDCGRGFSTELTLVAHRRAHTANPLHRCRCGKTFSNMTKFLYHRRTHAGKSGAPPTAAAPQQTIMCTELGETIAIIETSQPLALVDTLQLCQAALGATEASGLLQLDTAFV
ncbi:zinc finger domain-containing protein, partial [Eschrichtius robustus]|nr:zinc finger domain-containing protein [Eschrichtius robustus]